MTNKVYETCILGSDGVSGLIYIKFNYKIFILIVG